MVLRKIAAGLIALVVVIAGAFAVGILGVPSGGVEDVGDWGKAEEEQTEIITTVWVNNPNPIGVNLGSGLQANYTINMNGVPVAEGNKTGVSVGSGNNTIELRTFLQNEQLQPWWVTYVRNNETIHVTADGEATIDAGVGDADVPFPNVEETMLADQTPIITSLSESAAAAEGDYSRTVDVGAEDLTVGYEVREAYAEWGEVNQSATTVLFRYEIHNPGDVPVPAVPDGFEVDVRMNDVEMFGGGVDEMTPRDVAFDSMIPPGETQEVVFEMQMDNEKIDDWFRSHVQNNESTTVESEVRLVFQVEETGTTLRVPEDGVTYRCQLQTAILVDDQESETNCGSGGGVGA